MALVLTKPPIEPSGEMLQTRTEWKCMREKSRRRREEGCLLRRSRNKRCLPAFRPRSTQMPQTRIFRLNNLTS